MTQTAAGALDGVRVLDLTRIPASGQLAASFMNEVLGYFLRIEGGALRSLAQPSR